MVLTLLWKCEDMEMGGSVLDERGYFRRSKWDQELKVWYLYTKQLRDCEHIMLHEMFHNFTLGYKPGLQSDQSR